MPCTEFLEPASASLVPLSQTALVAPVLDQAKVNGVPAGAVVVLALKLQVGASVGGGLLRTTINPPCGRPSAKAPLVQSAASIEDVPYVLGDQIKWEAGLSVSKVAKCAEVSPLSVLETLYVVSDGVTVPTKSK